MAKGTLVCVVALWCTVSGVTLNSATADTAEGLKNTVRNGGFEAEGSTAGDPANWNPTRVSSMKEYHVLEWDDQVSHSGSRSAAITILENHPDVQIYYNWNQAPLACTPGSIYELVGWVRAQELVESAAISVQCWDRGMNNVLAFATTSNQTEVVGTTEWVEVHARFTVPEDTWRVVVLAGVPGHTNPGGKAWFDDIHVSPVVGE